MKINIIKNYLSLLFTFLIVSGALVSCAKDDGDVLFEGDSYQNIMQYIDANEEYSSFAKIVRTATMTDVLSSYNHHAGGSDYTLFLPDNAAVDLFIQTSEYYSSLDELLLDTIYSTEIVRFHTVNASIPSSDFPNGALADKPISNFFLTIIYTQEDDSISFAVNNESTVLLTDIEKSNGMIHTIDKMLTPVVYTAYDWLKESHSYTIFSDLLELTGLEDTLTYFELDDYGRDEYIEYTVLAESDELYSANGISSFQDLVNFVNPSDANYTSSDNALNKYARYHILEQSIFLDNFESAIYPTFCDDPVSVADDGFLKFNVGTEVFDIIYTEDDTTEINYLEVDMAASNQVTKTGPVHQLNHLLSPYTPSLMQVKCKFYTEPLISLYEETEGTYYIKAQELDYIDLYGITSLTYTKESETIEGCEDQDYIFLNGNLQFTYTTPRILPGKYQLKLTFKAGSSAYAHVQASVDGQKIGTVLDLTDKPTDKFYTYTVGNVDLTTLGTHDVNITTIVPGKLYIDRIIFEPIN